MFRQVLRRYRCTIILSLIAVLASVIPSLPQTMELDFHRVADGQWWRIWTGHLTHYDGDHLAWDLLMFVALGATCERAHPQRFMAAIAFMTAGISLIIGLMCSEIGFYRGLSGIDTGLFVWLVADRARHNFVDRNLLATSLWLLPVLGLVGKLFYESLTGTTLFVDASTFTPLVESHLAGVALGLMISQLLAWLPKWESTPRVSCP